MTIRTGQAVSLADLFAGMDLPVPDTTVTNISTSTRRLEHGALFLACAGLRHHGLEFVGDAIAAGAAAVAWEPTEGVSAPTLPDSVAGLEVPGLHNRLGLIADRFFGEPSARVAVTGITGTNGKSTTAYLVSQALTARGQTAGYMGTLGFGLGAELEPSSLTTPDCVEVHRRLDAMANAGAQHVVMEVSSHALDQQRVDGVRFRAAALTNISRDHLDYHRDMDRYAEAKARLFIGTGIETAVINTGDARGVSLARRLSDQADAPELLSVALVATNEQPGVDARLIGHLRGADAAGIGLQFSGDFGEACLDSNLWGRFNAENLVVAAGLLLAHGCSLVEAVDALRQCVAPPGRMELIRGGDTKPVVIVDYAHTPDALCKALEAVRDHATGQVWCVFGCGGDRDQGKRARMGAVAVELADHAIVTDDNPRDEDPQSIVADILSGSKEPMEVIRDRHEAINHAIRSAGANDAVLIAGKGHEVTQLVAGEARAFSDAKAARAALGRVA